MKKAIFNADDFGFSEKVNEGIVECFLNGVVTDSSVIMTMPATEHAISLIKKHKLNAGVHLDLTEGKHLSKVKNNSIINNDRFFGVGTIILKAFLKRLNKEDIEEEFSEQIERFKRRGIRPTHVDTHQYVHMIPIIFDAVAEVAKKYRIKALRVSSEDFSTRIYKLPNESVMSLFRPDVFKSIFISTLSNVSKTKLKKYGLKTTDNFFGIARVNSKNVLASFENIIKNLASGTSEIMCHPGYYDKEVEKFSYYAKQREDELSALTSPRIKELIKQYKIKLISFKDI